MLGRAVYGLFAPRATVKATDIRLTAPWVEFADVRDYQRLRESVLDFMPQIIVNLAALTDMELCEQEAENAWLTNALGAENLGLLANHVGAKHVYISTAGIFDGSQESFHDYDTPRPLSIYAKSKYAGEQFVRGNVCQHFVVRAGWMMGGGPGIDKKFIGKIFRQIAQGSKDIKVVDDKVGTPTYTKDFASGLCRLIESDLYGVYNQVCEGACSRYDVAVEFVRLLGLSDKVQVRRVNSAFFREEYFAPRPDNENLVNLKLTARGLNRMRDWRTALAEYAEEFRPHLPT
jgi:dTDP-4-dehydrorhamnose reductase